MVQTLRYQKRWYVTAALMAMTAAVLLLGGCGNKGSDTADVGMPTGSSSATHTSASGPAITDKVSFDQLTLESVPKATTDKNGLVFLHFKYADYDGKVYECVLPKAMSEGDFTLSEWSCTFNAYRLPKVIAQKKIEERDKYSDFPFISPKPQPVQEEEQEQQPQETMPIQPPPLQGDQGLPPLPPPLPAP